MKRWALQCVGCLLFFAWVPALAADDFALAATELARQIAGLTGPGTISLTIRNNSSVGAEEIPEIRRALLSGLSGLGVTVRERGIDATTSVRVTLSQTARNAVWVAEVQQGPEMRVAMVTLTSAPPAANKPEMQLTLRKTLLLTRTQPMLDAQIMALPGDAAGAGHLVVLSAEEIAVYGHGDKADGVWVKQQSFAIAHGRPYPRDVRGRLQADATGLFHAYLPGVVCSAAASGGPGFSVVCVDSDDPWPIGSNRAFYNSSRNYFSGVTIPNLGPGLAPFYSAAELTQGHGTASVYMEVSGQARLFDGNGLKLLAGSRDWGSDVAGIASGCGSGSQLVASSGGEGLQASLRAYEVEGRTAIAASAPLPLDGQVTAVWPGSGPGSGTATVIVARQQPMDYEAYRVSVVCSQ